MSRGRIDFDERKRSAEDTALWMKADVHKAQEVGASEITVKMKDLIEVLSYVDSIKARDKIEYQGKHLGFCKPEDMRLLLNHEKGGITIVAKRGEKFCCEVSFLELPPVKASPVKKTEVAEQNSDG